MSAVKEGLVLKADTMEELGEKIRKVAENKERMDPKVLAATAVEFNEGRREGQTRTSREHSGTT